MPFFPLIPWVPPPVVGDCFRPPMEMEGVLPNYSRFDDEHALRRRLDGYGLELELDGLHRFDELWAAAG
jgi:hypothetical protein